MELDWDNFLWPYNEAVRELKVKFRSLRQGFLTKGEHSPIEFVIGRVSKPYSYSICRRYLSGSRFDSCSR